jgi:hypothetical protein
MPSLGTDRVESAEFFQRATVLAIEPVAGTVAEQILHPHEEPLPTYHDQLEAAAFAAVAVASPRAVPAFLEYAKGEAAALINDHPDVAMAIADGLVEHGSLTGDEVDAIIASAIAAKATAVERQRRLDWKRIEESAASFVTSMTAPIASGWSGCRMGFAPIGKRRLCTAHTQGRHFSCRRIEC